MPFDINLSITGLQEAQRANLRAIASLRPGGMISRAVRDMTAAAHQHAVANTPWDTGSLRAVQRMEVNGLRGRVYLGGGKNPRSKTPPAEYGTYLHEQGMIPGLRGGVRAFYAYTEQKEGERILRTGAAQILQEWGRV